jgi:hypothetical protein
MGVDKEKFIYIIMFQFLSLKKTDGTIFQGDNLIAVLFGGLEDR